MQFLRKIFAAKLLFKQVQAWKDQEIRNVKKDKGGKWGIYIYSNKRNTEKVLACNNKVKKIEKGTRN